MGTNAQTLLDDLTTFEALLRCEARVHSYHCVPSSLSLFTQDVEECAPTGVHDALCQGMALCHVENVKLLNSNHLVLLGVLFGRFEMEITALTRDLEMRLRCIPGSLAASMTAFLASAQLALLASQGLLRGAIVARVFYGVALTIRQKGREANVNTDGRMLTRRGKVFRLGFGLTHDEGIPMSIRTQDQMDRFRRTLNGPMQLDLEAMPDLLGHDEVFLILMQIRIFAVLPQLDGMPAVRLLETGEAYTRDALLPGGKKALERRTQTISQHLNSGGRNMCALSLESRFQVILAWEGAFFLILSLDGLKHLVIDDARLFQALHEQMGLLLLHEQAILKGSHASILLQPMRNVKGIVPPAGGRQCTHLAKASGPLAAIW